MESFRKPNQGESVAPDFRLIVHSFSGEEIPRTTSLSTPEQIDESWLLQESQGFVSSFHDIGGPLGGFDNLHSEKFPVPFDTVEAFPLNQRDSSVDLLTRFDIETHNQLAYVKQQALNQIATFSQDANLREKLKTAFGDKGKTEDGLNLIKNR
ncbi:hypothetical protein [Crocosphaera sp. Alani8]|uniref:hypothetical protein n=1 Tax=Crocosphaera sp. Alani8 TaxID=3038952 RepID=UPI00313C87DC